jgi:hypothetical protein
MSGSGLRRRGFLAGLATALCAPAIVRTPGLLMPVKSLVIPKLEPVTSGLVMFENFAPGWQSRGVSRMVPNDEIGKMLAEIARSASSERPDFVRSDANTWAALGADLEKHFAKDFT